MAHSTAYRSLLLLCAVACLICASSGQTCKSQNFTSNFFQTCQDLPVLDAFLHWTYSPSNSTLDIAYWATPGSAGGWVAWAINPTATGMVGSQAIVGYVVSGKVNVITTNLSSYKPSMQNESLSFPVSNLAGQSSGKDIILFATLTLPTKNSTVNLVWQTGPMSGGVPSKHPFDEANLKSMKTLDLLSGQNTTTSGGDQNTTTSGGGQNTTTSGGVSKIRRKNLTFLANSFLFDLIVLLSVLAFYII
ncbi:cytochrome b561 and DOMON domain-containing protein At5g47530-like [Nymphaea colorata]|uniref:cytochrome b561 and DOMON domain-containing protein At5g47530-like n=1 Tax=Nymphaea colorata TaxID=210225 RepID=UPI00129D61DD|nr:cytochrome b561 and DOMON domain-containing protein At5g47530-like [Nymphaea colorata]